MHVLDVALSVGQQQLQFSLVGFVDDLAEPEASFPFSGLFGQDVACMGFPENEFSGACFFEALGCCTIGFDFRHFRILSTLFVHEKRDRLPVFHCLSHKIIDGVSH
jgi:hypothetical protein